MKKLLLASLTLTLACTVQALSAGILDNSSFEEAATDDQGDEMAASWGRWGHWINRETAWKPTRGGKAMMGYHHWRKEDNEESGFYQDVTNLEADMTYEFRVYAFKDPKTNADHIEIRLEELYGGKTIASETYDVEDMSHGGWRKLKVSGKIPSNGIRVAVKIVPRQDAAREGAIKFDDAKLSPVVL